MLEGEQAATPTAPMLSRPAGEGIRSRKSACGVLVWDLNQRQSVPHLSSLSGRQALLTCPIARQHSATSRPTPPSGTRLGAGVPCCWRLWRGRARPRPPPPGLRPSRCRCTNLKCAGRGGAAGRHTGRQRGRAASGWVSEVQGGPLDTSKGVGQRKAKLPEGGHVRLHTNNDVLRKT